MATANSKTSSSPQPLALPRLARRSPCLTSPSRVKLKKRTTNALEEGNVLQALLHDYVSPNAQQTEDEEQFRTVDFRTPERDKPQTEESKSEPARKTVKRICSMSVLHQHLVYPSAETSMRILRANRQVFERMQNILQGIESNRFRFAVRSCRAKQKRLNYFNCRARLAESDVASISPHSSSP